MHCTDLQSVMDSVHVYHENDLFTFSSTKRKQKKNECFKCCLPKQCINLQWESLQSYVIVDSRAKERNGRFSDAAGKTDTRLRSRAFAYSHTHIHTMTIDWWWLKLTLTKQLKCLFDVRTGAMEKKWNKIKTNKWNKRIKEFAIVSVYLLMGNCFKVDFAYNFLNSLCIVCILMRKIGKTIFIAKKTSFPGLHTHSHHPADKHKRLQFSSIS